MPAPGNGAQIPLQAASFLESGLRILERELCLGDDELSIDFLACDAAGAPVAILAVDQDDEDALPLRILDLDLWFRQNRFLLRQGLSRIGLDWAGLAWNRDLRIFVLSTGAALERAQRLDPLRGLDLKFFEFKSLRLRGELHWFVQEACAWRKNGSAAYLLSAPEGLEDPQLAELAEQILSRLDKLSPELESFGDRFHREVQLDGQTCLRLEVHNHRLRARIPCVDGELSVLAVESEEDVNRVLDGVLRSLLGWESESKGVDAWPRIDKTVGHAEGGHAEGGHAEPAGRAEEAAFGQRPRSADRSKSVSPMQVATEHPHPHHAAADVAGGMNLTEDEMEAFLNL